MRCSRTYFAVVLALFSTAMLVSSVAADPLPGQQLKFQQLPMDNLTIPNPDGTTYNGHDEVSTLYGNLDPTTGVVTEYRGISMADDFADPFSTPVVHVSWWGSYLDNFENPDQPVDKFLIAFETDVPAVSGVPGSFSRPGSVISTQIVNKVPAGGLLPGSGTYTETLVSSNPVPGEDLYLYNAELYLDKQFFQDPETVYWIKIAALIDSPEQAGIQSTRWGWHNRDYTVPNALALAVTPPVSPGERDERGEVPGGATYPTPVWHFQDDAVMNDVTTLTVDPLMPNMPTKLDQPEMAFFPQNYVDGLDGPGAVTDPNGTVLSIGISDFSKDLAFALYTIPIPEPSSVILMMIGLVALASNRRRYPLSS